MDSKERKKRGLAGRKWVTSEEAGFTAKIMGKRFIKNINTLFNNWKPQPKFHLLKVNEDLELDNLNTHPISLTPEFIKEIQSI